MDLKNRSFLFPPDLLMRPTVLCKSNAYEMHEFCSLSLRIWENSVFRAIILLNNRGNFVGFSTPL